LKMRQVFR